MNEGKSSSIDRFGAVASSLCAVHCAVCALLPAAFAALGLGFLLSPGAESLLAFMAILLGLGAVRLAWTTHRSTRVTGLLALGIVGLIGSRALELNSSHDHHGAEAHVAHHDDDHGSHDEGHHGAHEEGHDDEDHHEEEEGAHAHGHGDDSLHLAGAGIGVAGGLLLALGHLMNLRAVARCREECCD